jgi:hypothetical protein
MKRSLDSEHSKDVEHMRRPLLGAMDIVSRALGRGAQTEDLPPKDGDTTLAMRVRRIGGPGAATLRFVRPEGRDRVSGDEASVVVADRVHATVAARWRAERQSFVDLRGHVFLELPWIIIDREMPWRRPTAATEPTLDPFADRGSLVTRALLEHPATRTWGVREMATTADVALGTASRVLRALERRQLVERVDVGRAARIRVTESAALFRAWTERYDWTRNPGLAVAAPVSDPIDFVATLGRALRRRRPPVRAVLTLQAGAALVTPHAKWDTVHVYVDLATSSAVASLARTLGWRPSKQGRLVLMRPYYRRTVWEGTHRGKQSGLPRVSDLQLALDLWHYPVRGREQAEVVLAERLPWVLNS